VSVTYNQLVATMAGNFLNAGSLLVLTKYNSEIGALAVLLSWACAFVAVFTDDVWRESRVTVTSDHGCRVGDQIRFSEAGLVGFRVLEGTHVVTRVEDPQSAYVRPLWIFGFVRYAQLACVSLGAAAWGAAVTELALRIW